MPIIKPLTKIKQEFLHSVLRIGVPDGLSGPLAGWVKDLETPSKIKSYGRLANRFKVGTILEVSQQGWGSHPSGFAMTNVHGFSLKSYKSRSVLEVVTSLAEGLLWIGLHAPNYPMMDFGDCLMQVERFGSIPLEGIGRARDLMVAAGLLKETLNLPALVGDGSPKGFWFRGGVGWASRPMTAFVALTVFKLAVLKPDMVPMMGAGSRLALIRFLGQWKGLDDDARIAHVLLIKELGLFKPPIPNLEQGWKLHIGTGQAWPAFAGYLPRPEAKHQDKMLQYLQGAGSFEGIRPANVPTRAKVGNENWMSIAKFRLPYSGLLHDLLIRRPLEIFTDNFYGLELPFHPKRLSELQRIFGGSVQVNLRQNAVRIGTGWLKATPNAGMKLRRALLMLECIRRVEGELPVVEAEKPQKKRKGSRFIFQERC